jgi:hypothetical protein
MARGKSPSARKARPAPAPPGKRGRSPSPVPNEPRRGRDWIGPGLALLRGLYALSGVLVALPATPLAALGKLAYVACAAALGWLVVLAAPITISQWLRSPAGAGSAAGARARAAAAAAGCWLRGVCTAAVGLAALLVLLLYAWSWSAALGRAPPGQGLLLLDALRLLYIIPLLLLSAVPLKILGGTPTPWALILGALAGKVQFAAGGWPRINKLTERFDLKSFIRSPSVEWVQILGRPCGFQVGDRGGPVESSGPSLLRTQDQRCSTATSSGCSRGSRGPARPRCRRPRCRPALGVEAILGYHAPVSFFSGSLYKVYRSCSK